MPFMVTQADGVPHYWGPGPFGDAGFWVIKSN